MIGTRPFSAILHPSDLTEGSRIAFLHGLALCLRVKGELCILHSEDPDERKSWNDLPRVRQTLTQWGLLPDGASKEAVSDLGIRVTKVRIPASDPSRGIIKQVNYEQPDLLVMATRAREGLSRLLHAEVAKPVLRRTLTPGLLFPPGRSGFVDPNTGNLHLDRIMVAVAPEPSPQIALERAVALARSVGTPTGALREVYVGATADHPQTFPPPLEGWTWEQAQVTGPVAEALCDEARRWGAQVLVMASRGRDNLRELLLGSNLDRVLPNAPCPVLVVPMQFLE